ncbi:MAG: tRNA dihydrouridine synthase DusB [Firmicutes bacterium]|nr:tRNA dihydrouridine synthase DusB [Bacillota bacterium]
MGWEGRPLRFRPWKIGDVEIPNPTVLAPMSGVDSLPFRVLCRAYGVGLVTAEFISAAGLVHRSAQSLQMLRFVEVERPISIQIFGSDPDVMAEAAQIVEASGADLIDINMGCPVKKVVKTGAGAALMCEPQRAEAIVQTMVKAVHRPVTVKLRKGWDAHSVNVVELAKRLEQAGAQAIAIHGRTREEGYTGEADWGVIAAVKQAVQVPVIGNGDVRTPQDAQRMFEQTRVDAVMVGRGAQGTPWVFQRIVSMLQSGEVPPEPPISERIACALRHLQLMVEFRGESIGVREMRKHLSWYLKGLPRAAEVRAQINAAESQAEMKRALHQLMAG